MSVAPSPAVQVAEAFAQSLLVGNFTAAHASLSETARNRYSPLRLRLKYIIMLLPMRLFGNVPKSVEALQSMDNWPTKRPGDVAWIYVSIHGKNAGEAVSVVVAREATAL